MKRITLGIFAHVDAGKTTLSEALLYICGTIRQLGRVDYGNAFMDTDQQEKDRGITIFTKEAKLSYGDMEITLLDTPGHVDFSAETERTMGVLDYAIVVINGREGVKPHTKTLYRLLKKNNIPVFIFVNKMDMEGASREEILKNLNNELKDRVLDFTASEGEDFFEEVATSSEEMLNSYLEYGKVTTELIKSAITEKGLIPCYFGSALKMDGVEALLSGIDKYTLEIKYPSDFSARVYKIGSDKQGQRLTFLKLTGGSLAVKDLINDEKVNQIRLYSGEKYIAVNKACAGQICAVTGLNNTFSGQGIGKNTSRQDSSLKPVLSYRIILPEGVMPHVALQLMKPLTEEDPTLQIEWNEFEQAITIKLMGPIQMEVVKNIAKERFGLDIEFGKGKIIYQETIKEPVEGVGHYEPLKHFAEVHLLLKPGPRGSGIVFESACSEDVLDRNWQRLIMTHLNEKTFLGVLTGSPINDMKITILAGKAHLKHTEGGDFRQATYRAVRNGLMKAQSVLLEPIYEFTLAVPTENVGRAMTDIQNMGGSFEASMTDGDMSTIHGECPVATMGEYVNQVVTYTKGRGQLQYSVLGYEECHNSSEVIETKGYDAQGDLTNSGDSIFCIHGTGELVKWNRVQDYMSLPYVYEGRRYAGQNGGAFQSDFDQGKSDSGKDSDDELNRIFERTYGKRKEVFHSEKKEIRKPKTIDWSKDRVLDEYLLVDGYNIIFAWEELKDLAKVNIDGAREALIEILSNYQGFRKNNVIVVFDAYKVKGNVGTVEKVDDLSVVYTKEAETADMYIEKTTYIMDKQYYVRVATSDSLEQRIILGHGCHRVSARQLKEEIQQANCMISEIIMENNRRNSRNRITPEMIGIKPDDE